jgi:hypothetical protein
MIEYETFFSRIYILVDPNQFSLLINKLKTVKLDHLMEVEMYTLWNTHYYENFNSAY